MGVVKAWAGLQEVEELGDSRYRSGGESKCNQFSQDWRERREKRKKSWLGVGQGNWVKNSFLQMGEAPAHANTDGKGPVDTEVCDTGKRR